MRRTNYMPIKKTSDFPNIKQEQNHLKLDRTMSQEVQLKNILLNEAN